MSVLSAYYQAIPWLLLLHDPTVSTDHARIHFDGTDFHLEDAGSKNGTFIGETKLQSHQRYQLLGESHLRFGVVEVLFVVEETQREGSPYATQNAAAEVLVKEKKITREQRRQAVESAGEEGRHVGEMLLLQTPIKISDCEILMDEALVCLRERAGGKLVRAFLEMARTWPAPD